MSANLSRPWFDGLKSSPRAPRSQKAEKGLPIVRVEPRGPGGVADSHRLRRQGTSVLPRIGWSVAALAVAYFAGCCIPGLLGW